MSVSYSSSSDDSLLSPPNSTVNATSSFILGCYFTKLTSIVFGLFSISNVLILLPLCVIILHHGLQQWRRTRSTSSAVMSHSDSFMYHMVMMEMIGVFGCLLNFCAVTTNQSYLFAVGMYVLTFTYFGEIFFHILTCLERYLAVIHPITYRSLRKERGIRIRNICIGCVWGLSGLGLGLHRFLQFLAFYNFFILIFSLTVVFFCSVSVLCVLIRSGPRKQGGGSKRVDKTKRRAFYTILTILGVLMLRFVWEFLLTSLFILQAYFNCFMLTWSNWVYMPTSLVLPLLFLLTKGKLKNNCIYCKKL